ncbi:hypothetical protein Bbelb_254300 [Branchiostoma belcheri]|nr:hypothetical protein Bbelb_254300 [Branchiostoma belcheri]
MPVQSKQYRDKIVGLRFLSKDTIQFKDVLELVQKHGAQRGDIKGIQNKGKGVCEVMFTSQAALAKVAPTLALDTAVDCELFGKNFTVVTAIGIPMDMDDNYVRHRLQAYGTTDASRLLTYANLGFSEILSGTRQYRIKLKEHIPGSFRIGNDLIGIRYSGQPKLCHRCGSEEHFVADCTAVKCNKCCEIGHKADVCVNEIKCNVCGDTGHAGRACQLSFANRLSMGTSWAKPVAASTTSEHTKSSGPAETSPTETSSTAKSGDAARPAQADGGEEQDLEGEEENGNENEVSMGANEEEGMLPKLPYLTQALPDVGDTAQQTAPKPGTKPPREQVVKSNSPAKTKVCKAAPTTTDLPDEAQTLPKLLKGTPESTPLPEEGASKWMSDTEDTEIAQSADGLDLKLDESGDHISEYSSEDESATKRPLSSPSESSPSESEDSNTTRRPDKKIKKEAGKTAKGTGKVSPLSGNREVTYKTKSASSSRKRGRKETWLSDEIADSDIALEGYQAHRKDRNRRGGQVRLATNQTQSIKVILGDFNAKNSNWLASNTTDNPGRQLENLFLNHGLEQVLHEPTRGGNLLDLIATSHPAKCYQTGTLAPLGDSDHLITATALTIQASQHSGKRLVWLYDKADIEALHQDIATAPWDINLIFDSMDDVWDSWAKRLNTEDAWATYRRQRNLVTNLTRRAETVYIEDLVNDVETGNTRRFFTYAKSALGKTSTGIPALQVDSVILETPEAKANALNDFFIKQTDLPGRSDPIPTFQPTTVPESVLDSLQLSEEEVRQQLRTLQVGKSAGHDKITPRLLRLVADPISVPLTRLYNKSLLLGQVPTEWKKANVTPIHKAGNRHLTNNYRPISLLSTVSKVLETLVNKRLTAHVNRILTDNQSGFRPLDNTTLQLTRLVEEWTDAMDKGEIVGCVFLDLRKAFDKVWHAGLLSKLKSYGISGLMHDWFSSYLSDRKQRVVIQGATSTWKSPLAGLPQGSVLGPTLFILYINDLATSRTHCLANLFADDTSLSFSHHSVHRVVATLNRELSTVSTWLSTWKLEANIDKCKVMFITTRTLPQPIPPVTLGGTVLQVVTSHKHLGVTLTNTLSWSQHIEVISNKARRSSGLLCALRRKIPQNLLLRLYITITRPTLEYADIVWAGLTLRDQRTLESVQYQTARLISGHFGIPYPSYNSLYTELSLPSLQFRRKFHTAVTMYKLLNGRCPPHLQSLLPQARASATESRYPLRNSEHLSIPVYRTTRSQRTFVIRAITIWNTLPSETRTTRSISSFKKKLWTILDKYLTTPT